MQRPEQVDQAEAADETARGQRESEGTDGVPGQGAPQPVPGRGPGGDQQEEAGLDAVDDEEDAKEGIETHGRPDPTPAARHRAEAQPFPPRGGGFVFDFEELEPEEVLDLGGVEREPPEELPPPRGAADVEPEERGVEGCE